MSLAEAGRARTSLIIVSLLAGALLCPLGVGATPPLQRKAQALGFAAGDCAYCHVFDMEHMRKKARAAGVPDMNCGACHGKSLPKAGRDILSERGRWLLDEKLRRAARAIDVAWLSEYPVKDTRRAR